MHVILQVMQESDCYATQVSHKVNLFKYLRFTIAE